MALVELKIEERQDFGSVANRRLRRSGFIPGVVYSDGKDAMPLRLSEQHYDRVVSGRGSTQLYKFTSPSKELNGLMALIKAVQVEPVKDKILHVDFLSVHEGQRITVTVPVQLTGEAESVKLGLMILNQTLYELELECLPTEIPDAITVDISGLTPGHSIHARDLALPTGSKLRSDEGQTVVTLLERSEEEAAPTPAAAEAAPAEGAAAAPADGAAAPEKESKDKEKEKK